MSKAIRAEYEQMFLLPPSLEEWIPEDHPARFIRDFVESLDLEGMGFKESKTDEGRPCYSTDLLLKVWIYGYYKKIRSSRGLEQACYDHVGMIWLTGKHYPDHNTLWRFWRDNKAALRGVFREVVLVGKRSGLIGSELQAVDGSKIGANASKRKGWHLKELRRQLKGIEEEISKYIEEVESSDAVEKGEFRLPEELKDHENRKALIREAIRELESLGRSHLNPGDRDARMMKNGVGVEYSYNAQAVVDGDSGLMVAEEVVKEENDSSMLVPMIEEAGRNLGRMASETVADGGYYSAEQISQAQEKGIEVLLPIKEQVMPSSDEKEFHRTRFEYDEERDVYKCPLGKELEFEGVRINKSKKYAVRIYKCRDYKGCEKRSECGSSRHGRVIERGPYEGAVRHQAIKQQSPAKKELLKRRKAIIEPVFGQIKHNDGFRRFTVRGLENVKTQWSLVCAALDLRKLYRWWLGGMVTLA